MIKFDIQNRWSGDAQFTAEINCDEDAPRSEKLRLAVLCAVEDGADLSRADLLGANLREAKLSRADLSGANLSRADLSRADLSRADLLGANLREAKLWGADLSGANLREADLREAKLWGADLSGANLREADLSGANLREADLREAKLWGANLCLYGNVGNPHVRFIQTDVYQVAYTAEHMQIGCERHAIDAWWGFDDARIRAMDGKTALEWWKVWKPILKQMIEAAPCVPTGGNNND